MMLATTKVEDFDRFLKVFSTKGAEKRKQHGSKGAMVFSDPSEADRVWVIFDWDEQGFKNFVSDPSVPTTIVSPRFTSLRLPPVGPLRISSFRPSATTNVGRIILGKSLMMPWMS